MTSLNSLKVDPRGFSCLQLDKEWGLSCPTVVNCLGAIGFGPTVLWRLQSC